MTNGTEMAKEFMSGLIRVVREAVIDGHKGIITPQCRHAFIAFQIECLSVLSKMETPRKSEYRS